MSKKGSQSIQTLPRKIEQPRARGIAKNQDFMQFVSFDDLELGSGIKNVVSGKVPKNMREALIMDVTGDIIGLVPIVGDIYVPGIRQVRIRDTNLPENVKRGLMVIDGLDAVIGFVPIYGDIVDFLYFPNINYYITMRNQVKQ